MKENKLLAWIAVIITFGSAWAGSFFPKLIVPLVITVIITWVVALVLHYNATNPAMEQRDKTQ